MGGRTAGAIGCRVKHALVLVVAWNAATDCTGILVVAHHDLIGDACAHLADARDCTRIGGRAAGTIVDRLEDALKELLVPTVAGADVLVVTVWDLDGVEIILATRDAKAERQGKNGIG